MTVGILILLGFVFTVGFLSLGWLSLRSHMFASRGWEVAEAHMSRLLELQTIRISTLENRLLSHSWGEFSQLQHVPDEAAKIAYNEANREAWGLNQFERAVSEGFSDGSDLEGVDLEGPTIG